MKSITFVLAFLLGLFATAAVAQPAPRLTLITDSAGAWFSLSQDSPGEWSHLDLGGSYKRLHLGNLNTGNAWKARIKRHKKLIVKSPAGRRVTLRITPKNWPKPTRGIPWFYDIDSTSSRAALNLFYEMDAWHTNRQPVSYRLIWSTPDWICVQDMDSPDLKLMYLSANGGTFQRTTHGDLVYRSATDLVDVVPVHPRLEGLLSYQFQKLGLIDISKVNNAVWCHFPAMGNSVYTIVSTEEPPNVLYLPYHPGTTPLHLLQYQQVEERTGRSVKVANYSCLNVKSADELQTGDSVLYLNQSFLIQKK